MKLHLFALLTIFLLLNKFCYSQHSFKVKLNTYSVYVIKNGQQVFNEINGTKCKLVFKKDLYTLTFQTNKNTTGYQKFKVVSRNKDNVIVKVVGDLRQKSLKFIVKDSIKSKRKIDFISIDTGEESFGMRISD